MLGSSATGRICVRRDPIPDGCRAGRGSVLYKQEVPLWSSATIRFNFAETTGLSLRGIGPSDLRWIPLQLHTPGTVLRSMYYVHTLVGA